VTVCEIQSAQLAAVHRLLAEFEADVWAMTSSTAALRLRHALEQPERFLAVVCPVCNGSGELHRLANAPDPQTRVDYRCSRCGGTGVLEEDDDG
jgi:hypothetical protein